MAVAAYASILSLSHFLDRIQHPSMLRLPLNASQIVTLHEKLHFLQEFLELHSPTKIEGGIQDTMKQIIEVANEAEEIIDSHVVDQLRLEHEDKIDMCLPLLFSEAIIGAHVEDELCEASENKMNVGLSSPSFCQDIDKVIEKIDSIKEELLLTMVKAEGKAVQEQQPPRVSVRAGSSTLLPSRRNNTHVVGFDEHLVQIMELLHRDRPNLQIIPIVGMGGVGKTTLARLAFENKCVVEYFDVRFWFTISQEYSMHEILQGVLCDIGVTADLKSETLAALGQRLHKYLFGRRYLIVMDDLWSTKGWDDFKLSFPNCSNGSRVMVTTRLTDVAISLGSCSPYLMNFLDEDKSWNLFCEKAFGQESCSAELEEHGKKIAKSCRGLPLAITVIGGFLAKSNMTREYWQFVAENVSSYANSENDEHCLKILSLSYHHLPIHLKACFLYMRVFPEDCKIRVSELLNLWVGEGCLKPLRDTNLEETAKEYLKDLIDRNLISICERGLTGEIKICGIHDLLRDLCMKEFERENFFCVPKVQHMKFGREWHERVCFLCCDGYTQDRIDLPKVILRPWVCDACSTMHLHLNRLKFASATFEFAAGPSETSPLPTTLRYLTINVRSVSFSSIRLLWNLHTLNINNFHDCIALPSDIWEMPQLTHIKISYGFLLDPVDNLFEEKDCTILENLHTLSNIVHFTLTKEVLARIPNMKNLKISFCSPDYLHNLALLSKLESLSLEAHDIYSSQMIAFPHSLKKLSLNCHQRMDWRCMTAIGWLPNLEVLKLRSGPFFESEWHEWNPVEGQFLRLKFLSIGSTNLRRWNAEDIHFPCLETLVLSRIHDLEEIPSGIGEIGTLRLIYLHACGDTVMDSAIQIIEEQRSMGNDDLRLHATNLAMETIF